MSGDDTKSDDARHTHMDKQVRRSRFLKVGGAMLAVAIIPVAGLSLQGVIAAEKTTLLDIRPSEETCFSYGRFAASVELLETAYPENGEINADFLKHTADCSAAVVARGVIDVLLDPAATETRRHWDEQQAPRGAE